MGLQLAAALIGTSGGGAWCPGLWNVRLRGAISIRPRCACTAPAPLMLSAHRCAVGAAAEEDRTVRHCGEPACMHAGRAACAAHPLACPAAGPAHVPFRAVRAPPQWHEIIKPVLLLCTCTRTAQCTDRMHERVHIYMHGSGVCQPTHFMHHKALPWHSRAVSDPACRAVQHAVRDFLAEVACTQGRGSMAGLI